MPASASFLAACATAIGLLPERTAFAAAQVTLSAAGEDNRQAAWNTLYNDGQASLSLAYRLRRAIRDVVSNVQVSQGVTLSLADVEAANQALSASAVPEVAAPGAFATASTLSTDADLLRQVLYQLADT